MARFAKKALKWAVRFSGAILLGSSPLIVFLLMRYQMAALLLLLLLGTTLSLPNIRRKVVPQALRHAVWRDLKLFLSLSSEGPFYRAIIYCMRRFSPTGYWDGVPQRPANLKLTYTSSSIKIEWKTKRSGTALVLGDERYELRGESEADVYGDDVADDADPFNGNVGECTYKREGLSPGRAWSITLCAVSARGRSEPLKFSVRTKQVPVDGGGIEKCYCWTQSKEEIIVRAVLPAQVCARDIVWRAPGDSVHVACGGEVLLEGATPHRFDAEGAAWQLEGDAGRRELVLTLPKPRGGGGDAWPYVVTGGWPIDVALLPPDILKKAQKDDGMNPELAAAMRGLGPG